MNLLRQAELSMKGRKRHSVVDRQGNLLHITVHKANDTGAGCRVFEEAVQKYPALKGVCADAGYRNPMEEFENSIE
ncbi:hypothetical protein HE1_00259 [Holospora elegans E1]|uniref:Transposase IS4-like domain-containing protein n=1 Tax=Holospora elegans E1 TaxID=1427503 RepID=A0A023DX74_9PROT|nr:hypothetical protein [Holospora elegans]GAJ45941.1 hypothetical protein HE1_00259 [Holospora elegans E1]